MPNWCENDLYISGPQEQVDALLALMGDNFDFNAVLPYPAELRQRDDDARAWEKEHGWVKAREMLREKYGGDADGYNTGGYEWCISAWGTKWPAKGAQRRDLAFCCEEDYYREDRAWAAGVPCEEWKGEYRGERGG